MVQNRHLTLTFSIPKSILSKDFKLWEYVEQGSGFTVPNCYVDQSEITVGIKDKMGFIFCVTLYYK